MRRTCASTRSRFAREVAVCIESLQFHDRLMQQLTQVRNLLASLAAETLPGIGRSEILEHAGGEHPLPLHLRLAPHPVQPAAAGLGGRSMTAPSLHANEGSIELF